VHKLIHLIAGLLIFQSVAYAQHTPEQIRQTVEDAGGPEAMIKLMEKEAATTLPRMINKETELVAVASNGLRISFTQKMVNIVREDIKDFDAWKEASKNYMLCGSPVYGVLINEYGVEVAYIALSKRQAYLFEFRLNKETCAGKF